METLDCLSRIAPDWVKRLDELTGQIEQRQLDLANLAKLEGRKNSTSPSHSLRNKGSTESLKPKNDGNAFFNPDASQDPQQPEQTSNGATPDTKQQQQRSTRRRSSPDSGPKTPSFIQRQTEEVAATAQRRARAVLRKRQKTDSMVSAEGVVPTYRSRSMIIVYYDSFVQSFFEELVKFVSAQRNHLRRAKMAAKVAEIKRLAELEMPDDDDDDDDDSTLQPGDDLIAADPTIPTKPARSDPRLHYMSTRTMGPTYRSPNGIYAQGRSALTASGPGIINRAMSAGDQGPTDIFDELDRSLEFVQSMCEKAAHQFLRDGDCSEEIDKIKKRLEEARRSAQQEMDRLEKENPDAMKMDPPNPRSYRPSTMRRDHGASLPAKRVIKVDIDEGVEDMG
ncbi:hypothetical protein E8E14_011992 [Neopestalotiopsis sp. 37M]|jgi:hypothetical protein|nr:hypothetical protein E8E14_011992 [Neopestalotiopsis sp. 37M]